MESRRLWKSARRRARALPPAAVEELMRRLQRDAARIAAHFDLTYRAILPERPSVRGHYGICYEDGLIKIRLQHATRGTSLKYSSLINTLCHELAHLRHFDHGERFRELNVVILEWARRAGIYRPRRRGEPPAAPADCSVSPEERRLFLERMRAAVRGGPVAGRPAQLGLFSD